jgi:hypothetical protein
MTTPSRARRFVSLLAVSVALPAAFLGANACGNAPDTTTLAVGAVGSLRLALTATGPDDVTYQLRNGVFVISGRSGGLVTRVSTELDPSRRSLLVELLPDTYDVLLEPGFVLTVVDAASPGAGLTTRSESALKVPLSGLRRPASVDGGAPPLGRAVDAELVSDNPAAVLIAEDAVSPLSFVFRVDGDVVGERPGVLDLGIAIQADAGSAPVDCSDEFEPNDSSAAAAPLPVGAVLSATLCDEDRDFYSFEPDVAEGSGFSVRVGFRQDDGDIDAFLFDADGTLVASGQSVTDDEELFARADGRAFTLETRLFASVGSVAYSLRVGGEEDAPSNDCCEASEEPGCRDPGLLACACAIDPFCCEEAFDAACVELAAECGASCEPPVPSAPCCSPTGSPGCGDPEVEACVCDIDPFCCEEQFDSSCVELGLECGADCLR